MQQTIGFDWQCSTSFNCGQRALIHALLLLGVPISEDDAHKKTKIPRWFARLNGTNEQALIRGIRKVGCVPFAHSFSDSENAKEKIDSYLQSGLSIIINARMGCTGLFLQVNQIRSISGLIPMTTN